ncbi:MAG: PIN/TRAM domain-containing protein [Planctomycetaceae bacterium]|nr:MAG: PIN/TRAM domain-containing protein [Planctomycetaceae bacterium]
MTQRTNVPSSLLIAIRILYAFICAGAIASLVHPDNSLPRELENHRVATFFGLMLITQLVTVLDIVFRNKRLDLISAIYFGLLVGTLLAYLLTIALQPIVMSPQLRHIVVSLLVIVLPYICISLILQTKDDFRFVIPYVEFSKEVKGARPLIVDSSALIDGRLADILVTTNIFDTELLVPSFVLQELQAIADSNDKQRRTRGRRGLDMLSKLQQNPKVDVRVYEVKDKELPGVSVDERIIELAKRLGARVVTNDFNLNKVAGVHRVDVVNLNDLANALKPRYLPGDNVRIRVLREGESAGQGVGYLDDGTMVVCEGGATHIGREIEVTVTSVLQNSAGRMIFGRLAGSQALLSRASDNV